MKITKFPLPSAVKAFEGLKRDIASSAITLVNPDIPLEVETDTSDHTIAAALRQSRHLVVFFYRTLSQSEYRHSAVKKEVYPIVDALKNSNIS